MNTEVLGTLGGCLSHCVNYTKSNMYYTSGSSMYTNIHTHTHTCTYTYTHIYTYNIHTHTHTHIYTHTHTHNTHFYLSILIQFNEQ